MPCKNWTCKQNAYPQKSHRSLRAPVTPRRLSIIARVDQKTIKKKHLTYLAILSGQTPYIMCLRKKLREGKEKISKTFLSAAAFAANFKSFKALKPCSPIIRAFATQLLGDSLKTLHWSVLPAKAVVP